MLLQKFVHTAAWLFVNVTTARASTLTLSAYMVRMKQFDWLYENKFFTYIGKDVDGAQLVNAWTGGATVKPTPFLLEFFLKGEHRKWDLQT